MTKKKIILIILAVALIILLVPYRKDMLWDGGSVEYKSILCKYTKAHKLAEGNSGSSHRQSSSPAAAPRILP